MKSSKKTMLAIFAIIISSACVYAGDSKILTNKEGMTLYVFDKDKRSESVCYDTCTNNWPPFIAGPNAKIKADWGLTTRKDGSKQWTYHNQPLYTWVGDKKPGDINGDGVGGVWRSAKKVSYGHKRYNRPSAKAY